MPTVLNAFAPVAVAPVRAVEATAVQDASAFAGAAVIRAQRLGLRQPPGAFSSPTHPCPVPRSPRTVAPIEILKIQFLRSKMPAAFPCLAPVVVAPVKAVEGYRSPRRFAFAGPPSFAPASWTAPSPPGAFFHACQSAPTSNSSTTAIRSVLNR